MRNDYAVYCHTTPSGRKYVGISSDPVRRWNGGKGYCKNYLFARAINKYGWDNIRHDILFDHLTLNEAKAIEKKLIKKWNLTDAKYGMNLSGGGDGILADSTRELMSLAQKGRTHTSGFHVRESSKLLISKSLKEYYKTHDQAMKGKHHSEETKKKLRNRVFSDETREKMRKNHANVCGEKNPSAKLISQYSMDGKLIETYPYASMACRKYGLDLSSVIKCCRGKMKSSGGYVWKYAVSEVTS